MSILIGTRGRATTPLRPSGYIDVDGVRLEACLAPSQTSSLDIGGEVYIVGYNSFGRLVRPVADVSDPSSLPQFGGSILSREAHPEARTIEPKKNAEPMTTFDRWFTLLGPEGWGLLIGSLLAGLGAGVYTGSFAAAFMVFMGILAMVFILGAMGGFLIQLR